MRLIGRLTVAVLGLFVLTEAALRSAGAVDFPIYHVDDGIGYLPEPNQSGSFLRTHSWVFNDRSMGTREHWNPAGHPNILLIGNSVVMGGNPYDQKHKLGPLLQRDIGADYALWPIAAGGWTNVNEMVYLRRNPDVAASPRLFIWEYMSGGLSAPNSWHGEYVFPTKRPRYATWYVFRRYVWPHFFPADTNELPPVGEVSPVYRAEFESAVNSLSRATAADRPGIIFLYPKESEYLRAKAGKDWLPERADVNRIAAANGVTVIDIAVRPEWNAQLYRPDHTHPTIQGNAVLARILADAVTGLVH
jgi:hypothetical protein